MKGNNSVYSKWTTCSHYKATDIKAAETRNLFVYQTSVRALHVHGFLDVLYAVLVLL